MPRSAIPLLEAIADAISGIRAGTSGKSFDDYSKDWLLKRGAERGIGIISEASRRVPDELTSRHPGIPCPRIKAIGNVLRHQYHDIQDEVIWAVVERWLMPLDRATADMISHIDDRTG